MPAKRAPQDERFFPTVNNPPASVALPAVLTYLVVTPAALLFLAAAAGGVGPPDSNVVLRVAMALLALIVPGVVFGVIGSALGRVPSGCRLSTQALTIVVDHGNREIPLGQIERAEIVERRLVVDDKAVRPMMGPLNLEGEVNHARLGRLYVNLAGGSSNPSHHDPVVRVVLANDTSVVIDPMEAHGFVECLQAVLATRKLPEALPRFECTHIPSLQHQYRVERLNGYVPVPFLILGVVLFLAGTVGGIWLLSVMSFVFVVLATLALREQRYNPFETPRAAYAVALDATFLTLLCLGGARRFSLREVVGVERLEYYDFWAETSLSYEGPARPRYFHHKPPFASRFHHPKHGRGYINWRRLLPIDERAKPLVALRLKDKSLVVVDVDDPDALEAALRQRLASLPAPVALPGETPE